MANYYEKLTPEIRKAIMETKTLEDFAKVVKDAGIDLPAEKVEEIFKSIQSASIDDDALDMAAGGSSEANGCTTWTCGSPNKCTKDCAVKDWHY